MVLRGNEADWYSYFESLSSKYTIYLPDNLKTGFDVLQYYFSNP
jgi:hypothetical protein